MPLFAEVSASISELPVLPSTSAIPFKGRRRRGLLVLIYPSAALKGAALSPSFAAFGVAYNRLPAVYMKSALIL